MTSVNNISFQVKYIVRTKPNFFKLYLLKPKFPILSTLDCVEGVYVSRWLDAFKGSIIMPLNTVQSWHHTPACQATLKHLLGQLCLQKTKIFHID